MAAEREPQALISTLTAVCCVPGGCQAHLSCSSWGWSGLTFLGGSRTLASCFLPASGQAVQHQAESQALDSNEPGSEPWLPLNQLCGLGPATWLL